MSETRYIRVFENGLLVAEEPYEVDDEQIELEARERDIETAKAAIAEHPMAIMTADEADAWIESSVSSVATAKAALKVLARLLVHLRDRA